MQRGNILVARYYQQGLGVQGNSRKLWEAVKAAGIKPGFCDVRPVAADSEECGLYVTPKGKESWDLWPGRVEFAPTLEKVPVKKKRIPTFSVRFDADVTAVLRDKSKVPQPTEYIRQAVLHQLEKDGLV